MQKFSSFGRKKKQTKIRHRMVMLEGLQLPIKQVIVQIFYLLLFGVRGTIKSRSCDGFAILMELKRLVLKVHLI